MFDLRRRAPAAFGHTSCKRPMSLRPAQMLRTIRRFTLATADKAVVPALLAAVVVLLPAAAAGVPSSSIIRIEEDWAIEVGVPDPEENGPRISIVISPTDRLEGAHAVFELNHTTQPNYSAGGMQLQTWVGKANREACCFPNLRVLSTENENITFTLAMSLQGDQLRFDVLNGNSLTWHRFGGHGYLRATAPANLNHLGAYSSKTSTQHSRVSFAPHCVRKLVRKQVRYYTADGLLTKDSTECIVHSHSGGH